jgi:hypothetical protein
MPQQRFGRWRKASRGGDVGHGHRLLQMDTAAQDAPPQILGD